MFKDVNPGHWAYNSIAYATKTGLMSGFPDGTFKPDEPLTRAQFASILDRMRFRDGLFDDGVLDRVMPSIVCLCTATNLGSGVCIARKDGKSYILTNRHVVKDYKTFTVIKEGVSNFQAEIKIVSAVPNEDLALVQTDTELPPLPLALSPAIQGQPVAVVGAPVGLIESVTVGVVSHVSRNEDSWFQLDAPINPGNSGGPIVNEHGEIVGIAVAKIVGEAYEGIGYGIKLEIVRKFLQRVGVL